MEVRKHSLVNGHYYHIFSRSIAKYVIFNKADEYLRMLDILKLYRFREFNHKYSKFIKLDHKTQNTIIGNVSNKNLLLVDVVAYCLMPTHIHLLLKQIVDKGISRYLAKVLNSYSRFFNIKHQRMGPLWVGRFKNVLVSNDEQLLHLTRYFHLNPTSIGLVKKPEDWNFSSYHEYIGSVLNRNKICNFEDLFDIPSKKYKEFVSDRKDYQQEISRIKNLLIEDYTG